ncbi:hypothetical protein V8C40DRAFT_232117 [Trichoderma camerunense]
MREVSTTIWESFLAAGAWIALTAHRAARGDAASWPFPLMSQASLWCCFLVHRHFPLIVRQAGRQPHTRGRSHHPWFREKIENGHCYFWMGAISPCPCHAHGCAMTAPSELSQVRHTPPESLTSACLFTYLDEHPFYYYIFGIPGGTAYILASCSQGCRDPTGYECYCTVRCHADPHFTLSLYRAGMPPPRHPDFFYSQIH